MKRAWRSLPETRSPGWSMHLVYLALVVSLLAMAAQMVRVWWYPEWGNPEQEINHAVTIMVAEFFLVHAGVMTLAMSVLERKKHRLAFLAVILFYSVGCGSLVLYMGRGGSLLFVLNYALVILTRSWSAFTTRHERGPGIDAVVRSAAGVLFYLVAVFATISLPFPSGAIGRIKATGHGLWERHPEQVIGAATCFFVGMACVEAYLWYRSCRGSSVAKRADGEMPVLGMVSLLLVAASLLALWFLFFPDFFFVLLAFGAIFTGVLSRTNIGAVSFLLAIASLIIRFAKVMIFGF